MGTLLHVVHSPARDGPAGSEVLLAWVPHAGGLGGAHRVGEGGRIYSISCTLLPLSFCIGRKKGSSLGRGGEKPWATLTAVPHRTSHLGLAMALGVG